MIDQIPALHGHKTSPGHQYSHIESEGIKKNRFTKQYIRKLYGI